MKSFTFLLLAGSLLVLPACVLKPIDPYAGFNVAPDQQEKYKADETTCQAEADRRGFHVGDGAMDSWRYAFIRKCMQNDGWQLRQ